MVQIEEKISNLNALIVSAKRLPRIKCTDNVGVSLREKPLVQRGRETSNTLFNELEQWEQYLKSENLDVHILAFCKEIQQQTPKLQQIEGSLPDKQKSKRLRSAPRLRGPS